MKKFTSIAQSIIALLLALGLSACLESEQTAPEAADPETTPEAVQPDAPPPEATPEEAAPASADPAADAGPLSEGLAELLPAKLMLADGSEVDASALAGKPLVGIYFSAHWCPPCRGFTPQLVEFRDAHADEFEVVFVSSDKDLDTQKSYMTEYGMKWPAIPQTDAAGKELSRKYGVRGIPTLVVLGADGSTISKDARMDVARDAENALAKWKQAS